MPFTGSNYEAFAAVKCLADDIADKIHELAQYLNGSPYFLCLPYDWLNNLRWILQKTLKVLCQIHSSKMRMASSTKNVLRAVFKAMQLTGNLIHNDDLHGLHGNNLQHAEELHDEI